MNFINFGNTETFWSLFDKVFNRENITEITFFGKEVACGHFEEQNATVSSIGEDDNCESIKSSLRIALDSDGWYRYLVFLTVGGVEYGVEYYIPSKVLSEKLGAGLWKAVRKQLINNDRKFWSEKMKNNRL